MHFKRDPGMDCSKSAYDLLKGLPARSRFGKGQLHQIALETAALWNICII